MLLQVPARVKCPLCGAGCFCREGREVVNMASDTVAHVGFSKCLSCRNDLVFAKYPHGTHTWLLNEEKLMYKHIAGKRKGFVYSSKVHMFHTHTPIHSDLHKVRSMICEAASRLKSMKLNTVIIDYEGDAGTAENCDVYIRLPDEAYGGREISGLPHGSIMAERMISEYAHSVFNTVLITPFPMFTPEMYPGMDIRALNETADVEFFKEKISGMKSQRKNKKIIIGVNHE